MTPKFHYLKKKQLHISEEILTDIYDFLYGDESSGYKFIMMLLALFLQKNSFTAHRSDMLTDRIKEMFSKINKLELPSTDIVVSHKIPLKQVRNLNEMKTNLEKEIELIHALDSRDFQTVDRYTQLAHDFEEHNLNVEMLFARICRLNIEKQEMVNRVGHMAERARKTINSKLQQFVTDSNFGVKLLYSHVKELNETLKVIKDNETELIQKNKIVQCEHEKAINLLKKEHANQISKLHEEYKEKLRCMEERENKHKKKQQRFLSLHNECQLKEVNKHNVGKMFFGFFVNNKLVQHVSKITYQTITEHDLLLDQEMYLNMSKPSLQALLVLVSILCRMTKKTSIIWLRNEIARRSYPNLKSEDIKTSCIYQFYHTYVNPTSDKNVTSIYEFCACTEIDRREKFKKMYKLLDAEIGTMTTFFTCDTPKYQKAFKAIRARFFIKRKKGDCRIDKSEPIIVYDIPAYGTL